MKDVIEEDVQMKVDIVIKEEPVADDDMVCPYCGTEDIQMIGDPEYNDLWGCNNNHEFGSWIERKEFEPVKQKGFSQS